MKTKIRSTFSESAKKVELDDYIFSEETNDTRYVESAVGDSEQDKPFYENAPFIEQRQPKMSDSLLTNEFYVPKLQPAPAVGNVIK